MNWRLEHEGGSGRRRRGINGRQELERGQVGSVFMAHLAYVDASRVKTRLVWAEGAFVSGFGSWRLLISRFQTSRLSFRLQAEFRGVI